MANFICVLFGTKESYFDTRFKFTLIRISRDHISLEYKRMGLTQASKSLRCEEAFSFSEQCFANTEHCLRGFL